jgi:hypothetical protein
VTTTFSIRAPRTRASEMPEAGAGCVAVAARIVVAEIRTSSCGAAST